MAKKTKSNGQIDAPLFANIDLNTVHVIETVTEEIASKYKLEVGNFADPNRPPTCIENDFPILKINEIAGIEAEPPCTKPIYKMSKWWARRRSSVFRQILIASALSSPTNPNEAAQVSWSQMYRKSHRKLGLFKKLKVVDIFMGGGTTVVEAARLGFQVTGIDLNPMAWWIVHNETHPVPPERVEKFYKYLEQKVKPQIMPFFTTRSPRGFHGHWIDIKTNQKVEVDLFTLTPEKREQFKWQGPEIIYTFWMKHVMCADPNCNHLTPQISSASVAEKSAKIKFYDNCVCPECGDVFDLELSDFRIAPEAQLVLGVGENRYAYLEPGKLKTNCPNCKEVLDEAWITSQVRKKNKPKSKEVTHNLILPKEWLKGISGSGKEYFGGYYGSSEEQDSRWFSERSAGLKLIEVRGEIPDSLTHTNFGKKGKNQDSSSDGEEASSRLLVCGGCGRQQDPLSSVKLTGRMAPMFPYLIQGFDPEAKTRKYGYGGRFFSIPDFEQIKHSIKEYSTRGDIHEYIPKEELFYGFQTHHLQGGVPNHGYTHWYKMFNPRQLYVNALILKEISESSEDITDVQTKSQILGGWQNFLRHNCMFSIWHKGADQISPLFSNNNYHPKATCVENFAFGTIGVGTFEAFSSNVAVGMNFCKNPYDLRLSVEGEKGKTQKSISEDYIDSNNVKLICASSTDLKKDIESETIDLVVTDPPFGDNLNYSELADFFTVWLATPLSKIFPDVFTSKESPKTLEAVANKARHPGEDANGNRKCDLMYDRLLTLCWKEAFRILKPGGLMVFTFHHDKDVAWVGVLDSLFKAGFIIESTFPIRSDFTKGAGDFGAKKIEFDIVHVCRKRYGDPKDIFWATLRRRIIESVNSRATLLVQHKASGLHIADLEVIIRGEVLEQYSRHYGKVKKNLTGDLVTIREILIEANNIAQAMLQSTEQEKVPDSAEPETKIYFSLFRDAPSIEFNAARKRLKGSGTSLEELESFGWVTTGKVGKEKVSFVTSIGERWNSLARKKSFSSDLDQVHFAINCCIGGKQFDGKPADLESWIENNYKSLLPSVVPLLKYMEGNHFGADYKQAIGMAYRTIERTLNRIKETDGEYKKASDQLSLFE